MGQWITALLFAGLVLAACAMGPEPESETGAPPATKAACEAAGGHWGPGGIDGRALCVHPTPDAGAACTTSEDCSGFCLAETRSCSAVTPLFGCVAMLAADGAQVTLCLD